MLIMMICLVSLYRKVFSGRDKSDPEVFLESQFLLLINEAYDSANYIY